MPSVAQIKDQLAAVETFMASLAYASYKADLQADLVKTQNSILARPPVTDEDRGCVLMLYGEASAIASRLLLFEELRDDLKAELGKVQDETNDTPIQT